MKLSLIVPVYNRPECLEITLRSVASQSLNPTEFEVIICDDGSKNTGSLDVVKRYQNTMDIQYFYQPDRGFQAAKVRNRGLALARNPISVFLDAGVILSEHCLSAISKHHSQNFNTAIIGYVHGMDPHPINDELKQLCLSSTNPGKLINSSLIEEYPDTRERIYRDLDYDLSRFLAPWNQYWTALTTSPTRLALDIGGFDENFTEWGIEDLEFAFRLQQSGVEFALDSNVRGLHYPHDVTYKRDNRNNWIKFYDKHRDIDIETKLSTPSIYLEDTLHSMRREYNTSFSLNDPVLEEFLNTEIGKGLTGAIVAEGDSVIYSLSCFHVAVDINFDTNTSKLSAKDSASYIRGIGTRSGLPESAVPFCVIGTRYNRLGQSLQRKLLHEGMRISNNECFRINPIAENSAEGILDEFIETPIFKTEKHEVLQVNLRQPESQSVDN